MNLSGVSNFPDLSRLSSGSQTGQTNKSQSATNNNNAAATQGPASADHADLSASGLAAAHQAALSGNTADVANSDVRTQLVHSVQTAIQSGTYNVPASDVADRMIQSLLN
ncbi:MAG TPA: flagellar biosynthesis anti-sigma factor FlgM [Acidobacteriaceae bacterium]|nr:flagellar biosynthesis anti-sigma factor FlgM [Acidobacteriaceae bacterium]